MLDRTRTLRRLGALLVVFACALAIPVGAGAAVLDGALKQLALPDGCLSDAAGGGCKDLTAPMLNVGEPAMSPDSRHLYVPARDSDSLNWFDRDTATGKLTEKGCFRTVAVTGCTALSASPLEDATGAVVSPDGKSLYVVGGAAGGSAPDGIIHFTLDSNGTPTYDSCFNAGGTGGCAGAPSFSNPQTVAVSPDNKSVYVANYNNNSITVFQRNTATGTLSQVGLAATERCVRAFNDGASNTENCSIAQQIENPRDIEVTPDGKNVVIPNNGCFSFPGCYTMSEFDRNSTSGALTQHAPNGCVSIFGVAPCVTRSVFHGPTQLAVAGDGRGIYTVHRAGSVNAVMVTDRDPTTGHLTARSDWCIENPGSGSDCTPTSAALADPFDIALAPTTGDAYTAAYGGQRIGIFERQADRSLVPKPDKFGCIAVAADPACAPFNQGGNVEYILPSPDGRHVYAAGLGKIWTFAVDHGPRCQSFAVDTAHNSAVQMKLQCTDADGDALAFQIVDQPAKGTLGALQGDTVTYGPLLGTSGPDTFTFRATGAGVTADPATVTVNVAGVAITDADGDGVSTPADCNDTNPGIRPGATDIPGNGVDEDCAGGDAIVRLSSGVTHAWRAFAKYTEVTSLVATDLVAGSTVSVRCTGKGCPFKTKKISVKKAGKSSLVKLFNFKKKKKGAKKARKVVSKLRVKTKIEVRITKPGTIGRYVLFTMRKNNIPARTAGCLAQGTNAKVGCG